MIRAEREVGWVGYKRGQDPVERYHDPGPTRFHTHRARLGLRLEAEIPQPVDETSVEATVLTETMTSKVSISG